MERSQHLGIMVRYQTRMRPPFADQVFFKAMSLYGQKNGIDVTVFSPTSVLWRENKVLGFRYNSKKSSWEKGTFPIPSVLFDRIAYRNLSEIRKYHAKIRKLVSEKNIIILGRGLPGKWKVYNMIAYDPVLHSFLPETKEYTPELNLSHRLREYPALFLKPASGSNGKGVLKLYHTGDTFIVQGRSSTNKPFSKTFDHYKVCHQWIKQFIGVRKYIVQPYLSLSTIRTEEPFDLRILVQKNEKGTWEETGRAVRLGQKKGITSNLDGGGTALKASEFLPLHYTTKQLTKINEQINTIVNYLPSLLEEKHGALIELGIDIGIDQEGKVWILEVNSKPGRKSFHISNDQEAYIKSLLAPVKYTKHIISQFGGR